MANRSKHIFAGGFEKSTSLLFGKTRIGGRLPECRFIIIIIIIRVSTRRYRPFVERVFVRRKLIRPGNELIIKRRRRVRVRRYPGGTGRSFSITAARNVYLLMYGIFVFFFFVNVRFYSAFFYNDRPLFSLFACLFRPF